MATSSITKQFIVKDMEAFEKLMAEIEKQPEREVIPEEGSSLQKGREALKQFSLH